ncbi:hypothetical protein N0V90_009872 [Kalmusia sp. IMI 367209]|nr:hypothetical protein N0V90_009872 [Kalmusia sp. IMI 367209]
MGGFFSKSGSNSLATTPSHSELQNAVLHRDPSAVPPTVSAIKENKLHMSCGRTIYDGSGGAAVSNLGHSYKDRILKAIAVAARAVDYTARSDAVEAAAKLAIQYHIEKGQTQRQYFIARHQSYHGATALALALSGHKARRQPFQFSLPDNVRRVSSCFEYLQRKEGQSVEQFLNDKVQELEKTFAEIGPDKVIAFVCEPIVGAALGCVPPVKGYLKAMQDVCHKHGALFILDEIMCGAGRTGGNLHAFMHHDGVRPDILVMGKGLGGGMQPVSAMLCNRTVADALEENLSGFNHGYTFQNHPPVCAAAVEVLKIIEEDNLLENVKKQGKLLADLMREKLEVLPNVSPIRGQGLFQGVSQVEFSSLIVTYALQFSLLKDKATKESFDRKLKVALSIHEKAWKDPKYGIYVYWGTGSAADGLAGDHLIVAPPFTITTEEVHWLVGRLELVIKDYFKELEARGEK